MYISTGKVVFSMNFHDEEREVCTSGMLLLKTISPAKLIGISPAHRQERLAAQSAPREREEEKRMRCVQFLAVISDAALQCCEAVVAANGVVSGARLRHRR